MPAGRYMFIPFLKAKSQMVQKKNWPVKKLHNIAGILPENSRNSFAGLHSKKL